MPKKYPWQRWPDKDKKKKKKDSYSNQTKDPNWKESSIQDLKDKKTKHKKEEIKPKKKRRNILPKPIYMHEGYYETIEGARKAAKKHKGKVRYHSKGFWEGTYEVRAPVSRAKLLAIRIAERTKK